MYDFAHLIDGKGTEIFLSEVVVAAAITYRVLHFIDVQGSPF